MSSSSGATAQWGASHEEEAIVCQLIADIADVEKRDEALHELSKRRESIPNLACYLWYSFGTIAGFLTEITAVYPLLSPLTLSPAQSHRVCNCLALLQCIASHPEIKKLCLRAHVPLYLYPFLNTSGSHRSLEFLRLTALGVIGALVKGEDAEVLKFLLQSEIIPLCLRIMENGSELSQTVATFILQKILAYEEGLNYLCHTADRFYAVSSVLNTMISNTRDPPPCPRLVKHIVKCYLRLCDNARAREAFRHCFPQALRGEAFTKVVEQDPLVVKWLAQLLATLNVPPSLPAHNPTASAANVGDQVIAADASGPPTQQQPSPARAVQQQT